MNIFNIEKKKNCNERHINCLEKLFNFKIRVYSLQQEQQGLKRMQNTKLK